jgi:predicted heme/steroid binding protein
MFSGFLIFGEKDQVINESVNSTKSPENTPIQKDTVPEKDFLNDVSSNSRKFTPVELAQYDGKNGNPAYVAVDGVVYDLTRVFRSGAHYGHFAGKELTQAFYMQHVKSEITKYPVVGILE